jgi:hypothetical protein
MVFFPIYKFLFGLEIRNPFAIGTGCEQYDPGKDLGSRHSSKL